MEKLEARIRKLNEERFEERQSAASRIEALEETLKQEKSQHDVELTQMEKDMMVALSAAKNYEQEQVQSKDQSGVKFFAGQIHAVSFSFHNGPFIAS